MHHLLFEFYTKASSPYVLVASSQAEHKGFILRGPDHRGSTPEGKASVVSEHLCVGETKTANRVLQEIRTHFSRPVIG